MFRRRLIAPSDFDPFVIDRHGRIVGMRTRPPKEAPETPAVRWWRRKRNLIATGELRASAEVRNQSSWLHVDPPGH